MELEHTKGFEVIRDWFESKKKQPFLFQKQAWHHIITGASGLINAPTGCGKTYSVFLGALIDFINLNPEKYRAKKSCGLQLLWITPLRALAKDIKRVMDEVIGELGMNWTIGIRNGDTPVSEREKQNVRLPEVLIITPESLHLLLARKGYPALFQTVRIVAVDEWHELLGSKRGVQVELAISRIIGIKSQSGNGGFSSDIRTKDGSETRNENPDNDPDTSSGFKIPKVSVWGISATIGNIEEAMEVLLSGMKTDGVLIIADNKKDTEVRSIFPDEIEKFPWSGHLGLRLAEKVIPIIKESRTTLIFINTRGMSETWYQKILDICPELAGSIALHHGSIDRELRVWIEENLHSGTLRAVVCTASLDLGVDFRPVDTVIQVGSPKGVARFLQRAGRSGHSPGAVSRIYFLPTHSLELMEAAAIKSALAEQMIESRPPMVMCYDVLLQYLNTLAISEGFAPGQIYKEVQSTFCYRDLTFLEWEKILHFITEGGDAMHQYDDFKKVEIENGLFTIRSRKLAMRHRLHIGTIVSDALMKVKFMTGGYIGVIEEYFISRLAPGDVFTLAGKKLEFVMIQDMTALVRKSSSKKSIVPSWQGGRMPLSANLGKKLRQTLDIALDGNREKAEELMLLEPLFSLQQQLSGIPKKDELLIEQIETKDGFHLFVYPFEGRLVHEALASILAYRISRIRAISFSFAMNDYGFELLSDQPIPLDDTNVYELFSPEHLLDDIQRSMNSTEMARRKFRDIAVIGGLVFPGMPGEKKKARHIQSSASLLFNVFSEYDPGNVLLRQSYQEVLDQQMEEVRLRDLLDRIQKSKVLLTFPSQLTPFCFPVKVDSLREELSSEKLEDRVRKMQQYLEQ